MKRKGKEKITERQTGQGGGCFLFKKKTGLAETQIQKRGERERERERERKIEEKKVLDSSPL